MQPLLCPPPLSLPSFLLSIPGVRRPNWKNTHQALQERGSTRRHLWVWFLGELVTAQLPLKKSASQIPSHFNTWAFVYLMRVRVTWDITGSSDFLWVCILVTLEFHIYWVLVRIQIYQPGIPNSQDCIFSQNLSSKLYLVYPSAEMTPPLRCLKLNINQTLHSTPAPKPIPPSAFPPQKIEPSPPPLTDTGNWTSYLTLPHFSLWPELLHQSPSRSPCFHPVLPYNLFTQQSRVTSSKYVTGPHLFPSWNLTHFLILHLFACYIGFKHQERRGHTWFFPSKAAHNAFAQCWAYHRNSIHYLLKTMKNKIRKSFHIMSFLATSPLASLNIWSSSCRRLSSTWRRPLSSASRILRCRSASMARAWTLLSSCSLTSSLDRKSNMSASTHPSSPAKWFSTSDTLKIII